MLLIRRIVRPAAPGGRSLRPRHTSQGELAHIKKKPGDRSLQTRRLNHVLDISCSGEYPPRCFRGRLSMGKDRVSLGATAVLVSLFTASLAFAEVKTITATGEYRMGDNDTRTDGKRLALLDAKRLALEQAGIYLESVTEVKNLQVSHDELRRAYTAGIIEVLEQTSTSTMEGQQHVIRVAVQPPHGWEGAVRVATSSGGGGTVRAWRLSSDS